MANLPLRGVPVPFSLSRIVPWSEALAVPRAVSFLPAPSSCACTHIHASSAHSAHASRRVSQGL